MDDLRDLAKPDNPDIDLLHWPLPHRPCPFRSGTFVPYTGLTHTPYLLASHLRLTICAAAGRRIDSLESSSDYAGGIEKTDHSAYRVVRHRRRILRQRRDTRLLDLAHPHVDGASRARSGSGRAGADGPRRWRARRVSHRRSTH